jgi:hypothetical protein
MMYSTLSALAIVGVANAHFIVKYPPYIGFDEEYQVVGPCGKYDPSDKTAKVTEWPIAGSYVSIETSHSSAKYELKAAKLSNVTNWVSLGAPLVQTSSGDYCSKSVPGLADWKGEDAVLQVTLKDEDGSEGDLYQVRTAFFTTTLSIH